MALVTLPRQLTVDINGEPRVGALLYVYDAGTDNTRIAYTTKAFDVELVQPVQSVEGGIFPAIYVNPAGGDFKLVIKDSFGSPIYTEDNIPAQLGATDIDLAGVATESQTTPIIFSLRRSAAEISAGVTPVNYSYPAQPLNILRFGTNTTPGVTDMSAAFQTAINVALAAIGSGKAGVSIYIPAGAYSIVTPPTFGGASTVMLPITIYGDGEATQLIHNGAASTAPLLNLGSHGGWTLRDFLICGNSAHKNDGIYAGAVSGTLQTRWTIERVTAMMAGVGLKIAETNTGQVIRFRSWPNSMGPLQVPQAVTNSDISYHIHLTGGFVHNVSFYDCDCLPSNAYGVNRGFYLDCSASYGCAIIGGDYETNSGTNTEVGIYLNPSGQAGDWRICGVYHEGTIVQLNNVSNSDIGPLTDGEIGGTLFLDTACRNNIIHGVRLAVLTVNATSSYGNTFVGCNFRTTVTDSSHAPNVSEQPNRWIGCSYAGTLIADRGTKWRKVVTQSAAGTLTPNALAYNILVVRVTTTSAFTIAAPTNPYNGQELIITIRNESGGAMGTITWSSIFVAGWTNPADTFNRSICIYYDTDFSVWRQAWVGTADVAG
jgi:hypothetical protein